VYIINNNDDIMNIFDDIYNYKFYSDKFKKENKILYPISNFIIDKKCLKILLLSIDKINNTNKEISKLFIKYKIYLNKVSKKKKNNNIILLHSNKKKLLYLVLCCDNKPIYIDNQKKVIEMLENAKVDYLLLKGNTETTNYNKDIKTLFVDVVDVYENLPIKIYKGYEWVYNNTDYNFVYKIDDNFIFTDKNKVSNEMYDYYGNYLVKNLDRRWHFGKCANNELNNLEYAGKFIAPYAAGGFGYILSRKSLETLLKNKEFFYDKNEIYEDKIVGDILYKNKIFVVNNINYGKINNNLNTSIILFDHKKDNFTNIDISILNSNNLLINKLKKKIILQILLFH
jgi:hypothetical protein